MVTGVDAACLAFRTSHGAWIDFLRRSIVASVFLGVAVWGLHQQNFVHALLWDKRTNR